MKIKLLYIIVSLICMTSCKWRSNEEFNYNSYTYYKGEVYRFFYMIKDCLPARVVLMPIKIDYPVLCNIDGNYYVFPDSTIKEYRGDDSSFICREDVFKYSYYWGSSDFYWNIDVVFMDFHTLSDYFLPYEIKTIDTVYNMPIYKFVVEPEKFMLLLESQGIDTCDMDDVFDYALYKKYIPTVDPYFSNEGMNTIIYRQEHHITDIKDSIL